SVTRSLNRRTIATEATPITADSPLHAQPKSVAGSATGCLPRPVQSDFREADALASRYPPTRPRRRVVHASRHPEMLGERGIPRERSGSPHRLTRCSPSIEDVRQGAKAPRATRGGREINQAPQP